MKFVRAILAASLLAGAAPLSAQVLLNEILFDPVGIDAGRQLVELRNGGAGDVNIGGWWLSMKPAAWEFPAETIIPGGGLLVIHLGRPGPQTATDLYTGTAGMRTLRRQDSIALFSESLFSDPSKLIDFAEWGQAGLTGEDVAISAGKWIPAAPIPVDSLREGSSIALQGNGPFAAAWCVDGAPSFGSPNDDCTISRAQSPSRFNEVRPGPDSAVELKNFDGIIEDLEGKWIVSPTSSYRIPAGAVLLPGELLVVYLGSSGVNAPGRYYTGPDFQPLQSTDSVALSVAPGQTSDGTTVIDFLEWGAGGQALESAAVEAGRWEAGQAVDVSHLAPSGSMAVIPGVSGIARWKADNTPTLGLQNDALPVSPVVINELLLSPAVPGEGQAVELYNPGESAADLSGMSVCASASDGAAAVCDTLPDPSVVPSRGYLVLRIGGAEPGVGEISLPNLSPLNENSGELAILVGAYVLESDNYLNYLRWGGGSPVLEGLSADEGLWPKGDSLEVSAVARGSSLSYLGDGIGSASFRIDSTPSLGLPNAEKPPEKSFVRGDCNQDGVRDISDPITIFGFLFYGQVVPDCEDAFDTNDDGNLDISDAIYLLDVLFIKPGSQPSLSCSPDLNPDHLYCAVFRGC